MRRHALLMLTLMLVMALSACAFAEEQGTPEKFGLLGHLSKLNITAEELNAAIQEENARAVYSEVVFYDDLNSMLLGLENGDICMMYLDENTARYVASRNEQCVARKNKGIGPYELSYAMLLMDENTGLRDKISAAIGDIKADGTMEALKKAYIDDCIAGNEPEAVMPETFEGAETIRVAVTGDRPPMDYINAGGEPVGFNTAVIAEVAKRLEMNVELVSVNCGSRAIALSTGAADIVFWMEGGNFDNWEGSASEDQPEHTIVTDPYLSCHDLCVVLKSSPLAELLEAE